MDQKTSNIGFGLPDDPFLINNIKRIQNANKSALNNNQLVQFAWPDPDMMKFLNPPLQGMAMVRVGGDLDGYNTLAVTNPSQDLNTPALYAQGDQAIMKKAGVDALGLNTLLPGSDPATFESDNTKMIQRRKKVYYGDGDPWFTWEVTAVAVPMDYVLGVNERLDNGFYPGYMLHNQAYRHQIFPGDNDPLITNTDISNNIYQGTYYGSQSDSAGIIISNDLAYTPYGQSFPVGPNGGLLYSDLPFFVRKAWTGQVYEVPKEDLYKTSITDVQAFYGRGDLKDTPLPVVDGKFQVMQGVSFYLKVSGHGLAGVADKIYDYFTGDQEFKDYLFTYRQADGPLFFLRNIFLGNHRPTAFSNMYNENWYLQNNFPANFTGPDDPALTPGDYGLVQLTLGFDLNYGAGDPTTDILSGLDNQTYGIYDLGVLDLVAVGYQGHVVRKKDVLEVIKNPDLPQPFLGMYTFGF